MQNRRNFIKMAAMAGAAVSVGGQSVFAARPVSPGKRIGIIGLDTSHSLAFTKVLNAADADGRLKSYKVVAAYPFGSKSIATSVKRIPGYTEEIKRLGVKIVDSIQQLLEQVDVVMLETNDGTLHLEQALPVIAAGKRLFVDKPMAASLADARAIFDAATKHHVQVFSSSSLRYAENISDIRLGKLVGHVTGADTFSPAILEPSHPDLFWYGIHGVEMLYAVMGKGCRSVVRTHTEGADVVVGTWEDGRIGVFRGLRNGKHAYGGVAFGTDGQVAIGPYTGYLPLLYQIVDFFESGLSPVAPEETLEILAFMEAADRSKRSGKAEAIQV